MWERARLWRVDIKSGRRSYNLTSYSNTKYKSRASRYSVLSSKASTSQTTSSSSPCRPIPRQVSQSAFQLPSRTSRNTRSTSFQWKSLWSEARHWDTSILTRSVYSQNWSPGKKTWTSTSRLCHISIIRHQAQWHKSFPPGGKSHHSSLLPANRSWAQLMASRTSRSTTMTNQHHR